MTLKQYKDIAKSCGDNNLRRGQMMFNKLCVFDVDVANKIRKSECDPFYRDDRIELFLIKLLDYVE